MTVNGTKLKLRKLEDGTKEIAKVIRINNVIPIFGIYNSPAIQCDDF